MTNETTKATHTPGPWVVLHEHFTRWNVYSDGAQYEIVNDVNGATNFEIEANARLIAAAPDLLAALEAYQKANRLHNDAEAELYEQGDAALIKARGAS